jgi:hypothetical protein
MENKAMKLRILESTIAYDQTAIKGETGYDKPESLCH